MPATRSPPDQVVAGPGALEDSVDLAIRTIQAEGERGVVAVQGDLDLFTAPTVRDHFIDLIAAGQYHLVIDLDGVEFLDSTGIGALVAVLRRARATGGSVRLVCTNGRIQWLLGITGVLKDLPTFETYAEACAAASGPG